MAFTCSEVDDEDELSSMCSLYQDEAPKPDGIALHRLSRLGFELEKSQTCTSNGVFHELEDDLFLL
ncbi:Galactinol--sucrose galactosyltransferase [Psidium guajava]|nr:Galactinol--sucrose galactosyltransferase [Psidium guajava]